MACYKITVNGKELPFKFATQAEAQNFASKLVSNPSVPNSFIAKVGNSDYLDYRKLEEFMMYDTMYSLSYNSLTYGDISLGHKDSIDVVKRNGNLPSDGLSLGYGKAKTAIVKSTLEIVDGRELDTQDAQTYASPHWYLNKYLKATSKADKEVVRIYKEKIIPGFELTPEEVATLKAAKADLTDRKIVVRTHFDLIKTAFHIQSREKVSKLRNDTPQERQNIIKLYELAEQAQTLEDKRKILERIHEKYDPIYKYHHDMLNTIELNELDYITVDSSAKLLQHNVGDYDANAGFRIAPYYISDHFIREQMQTDRKSMSTVHGSQLQGLFFGEQDETLEIETPKGKTTVGQIIERYFKIKADRTQKTREKILEDLITDDGELNFDEVVNVIMSQSNAAQGDAVRAALMEVVDNNPNVSLNNSLLSKDFATALMSKLDKSLKTKVPGKAYTLVSDVGHNVFIDEKGNIVPRKNWRPGLQQRRLDFNKKKGDLYYAEVIVSEEILTKLGVSSIEEANDALFGLGVRIPTEGKNSSVIIKIVDTLPSTYSSTLIAPPELLLYSGADFDIDKLYVRHYSLSSDKKKFGHYLTLKSKAARLKRAKQEYLESTGKAVPENFEELVEANYADPLNSTPLTIEEGNNDLLDMEMYMAYNQHTESQAKYENSLAVLKDIMVPFLKQGQLAAEVKDANTVYTTLDKLLAQESIDIGKDNIGVAAVANIMNTLLSRHKYEFGTAYNKSRAFGVSEVDLADTKLDSKGLTTNGKMRLPALIAVLLNAMTDNAKEQLAYDLSLDKKNLATYLYGISIGIDPKTMLISIQDLDSMPNVRPEVLKYLAAEQEQRDEIIKELKGQNREDAIEYLEVADKVYNSIDDVDIRNLFSLRQPFLGLTLDDSIGISKLLMMQTNRSIEKFSTDLFDLINVRALVKGISKDFVSLDNVLTSIEEVGVGYTKGETTNEDNLYSRVFTKGDDVYYRPVLGQKEVVKYTFTYAGGFGNIIKNQPDVFELIATAIVYDNEIFGKVSLKRNSIVRNYFGFTGYKYNNFLNAEDRDSLVNSFVNYIPSRIYENKYNIAIDTTEGARQEALQYIRDNIRNFNLVYHPFDQQSKLAKLREKLIAPDSVFNNNLFVNSLIVKTTNTKNPKFKATTISIDTLNEVTSGHKDMVASDFQVLNRVKIPATSLKELDSKPVEDLTANEAAYLFALYVQEYSLLIENSSYRKGSLTTVLPKETVFNVYKQLNAVDELFKEYASKSADKNFYIRFKELTGTEFERFYIEFMEYEAANNGYKALARKIKNFKTLKEVNAYTPKSTFIDRTVTLKNGTKRKINLQTIVTADMLRFDTDTVNSNTLFKNRYFVRGHEYQGYKPMVFPPSLKSSGPTLFISRIVAADVKGDLYEYVYDRGQVYKTKVDEKYQPISDTVETDFMPMSGIRADYSTIKRYSDRILSNSLSPAAFHAKKAEFAVETDKPVDTETQLDINDSQTDGEYEGSAFIQSGPLGQMSGQQQSSYQITTTNYTKDTAPNNPDVGYVFTENAEMLDTNKNVSMTQAVIRTDRNGNKNPNALPIITKKLQVAGGQWTNSEEDFNEFKRLNTELIDRIKNSSYSKIVFPPGFATEKAKMPTRFAEWLQQALLDNFGLITELNSTKTGLISKSIQQLTQQTINIYAGTGENAELSNLAKRPFIDEGIRDLGSNYLEVTGKPIKWNTVEGAYQAEKLMYSDDYSDKSKEAWTLNQEGIDLIERLASASGKEAKAIGRTITGLNVDEWNKDSSNVMQDYIYFSFEQNPDALQLLLNTGNATLTHTQDKSKWGKEFPRILMEVREDFKNSSVTQQQPQVGVTSVKNIFTVEPRQAVDKKAKSKAKIATQYIGFAEGISGSSTALYAEQAGQYANTGNYNSNDVIFVSVPGKRGSAELQKQNQDKTIKEAIKAVEAGATIITDNKEYIDSNSYNTGEKRLFANMQSKGYTYSEVIVDGQTLGTWSKLTQQQPTQERTISYTPKGKQRQTYTIRGSQIFNEKGKEVFKEDSVDRNKIFANLAVQEGRAVVVEHKGTNYVVNKKGQIVSGTTGKLMQWGEENGDRKAILAKAGVIEPSTQQQTKPKGGLGGGLEGGPMMGEPQLLPINEFVNSMLNKHYVNGTILDKTALFRDVQNYNNTLGYEAVVVNKDLSITPNVSQALNAKNGVDYATSLLDRLSAKFNIPYVIDNTMPYKGKFMNGKVYINTRLMTDDTAFHEFAHPFIAAVKRINRPLYNNLVKEIKKEGKILAKTDKLYRKYFQEKGLTKQQVEAAIIEEAIVQALGEYAADAKKMFDKSTGLFDALTRFFIFIKQSIKALFNKEKINIDAIPNDATLKELAIILASDIPLVNDTRMRNEVLDVLKQIDKCS